MEYLQYTEKVLQFVKENPKLIDGITQSYSQKIEEMFGDDSPQALKDIDEALSTYHAQSKNPLIGDILNILCLESKEEDGKIKSLEMLSSDTFCGITLDKLTKDQKKLFDKLNPIERKKLSEIVLHNKAESQFEFSNTARGKLAMQDKDSGTNVIKLSAIAKKTENDWKLPEDVDYKTKNLNRNKLYPEFSDFDAMIAQMPGDTDGEKVENFRLLTGMSGPYWTGTFYNTSTPVIRYFNNDDRSRDYYGRYKYSHVRLVRSLKA